MTNRKSEDTAGGWAELLGRWVLSTYLTGGLAVLLAFLMFGAAGGDADDKYVPLAQAWDTSAFGIIALFVIAGGLATAATAKSTRLWPYAVAILVAGATSGVILYFIALG